jgi:hypothetical protein
MPNTTTTCIIAPWSSMSALGSGSVFFIARSAGQTRPALHRAIPGARTCGRRRLPPPVTRGRQNPRCLSCRCPQALP